MRSAKRGTRSCCCKSAAAASSPLSVSACPRSGICRKGLLTPPEMEGLVFHDFALPIALEIEQRRQIAMDNACARFRGDHRFCMISNSEAGASDHLEVIRPVADGQRVCKGNPPLRNR